MIAAGEVGTRTMRHVTCLGCGCACDDIAVVTEGGRIARVEAACPLGVAWFGDGRVPARATVRGAPSALDSALDTAAALLVGADRVLVLLAPELSCEAQREAVAIADRLGAIVDVASSPGERALLLATQRRGNASATLGELRHRADVVVFWGVDPMRTHPRFAARFLPVARGMEAPEGRASRYVVAVDLGDGRAYEDSDVRFRVPREREVEALGVLRAFVLGRTLELPGDGEHAWLGAMTELAPRLAGARYAALICDAGDRETDARRAEAIVALAQALNDVTRAAQVVLRGGGNRAGAESVLTWQTGYPAAVDFARGAPRYDPDRDPVVLLRDGVVDVALVLGNYASIDAPAREALASSETVAVGPRATEAARDARVAIDTGVPGIHEAGLAMRMDGVPLPLRAPLPGMPSTVTIARSLAARLRPHEVVA